MSTETDDDSAEAAEEDTPTAEQQALALHVAMYNAVNDTSEKLSTEPNGDSLRRVFARVEVFQSRRSANSQ